MKNKFRLISSLLAVLILSSCDNLQTGKGLYRSGLVYYKAADHGDYFNLKLLEKAINKFEKSIKKGLEERDVFDKLATSYILLNNDRESAERIYSLGLKKHPNDIEFYFYRGNCRKELKEYHGAFSDFNQAISLDKKEEYVYRNSTYYERGAMRYILGDTVNAFEDRAIAQKMTDHALRAYSDYLRLWK